MLVSACTNLHIIPIFAGGVCTVKKRLQAPVADHFQMLKRWAEYESKAFKFVSIIFCQRVLIKMRIGPLP